jgi:hypothetical protein
MWQDRRRDVTELMDTCCILWIRLTCIMKGMIRICTFKSSQSCSGSFLTFVNISTQDEMPHPVTDLYSMFWCHKLQHPHRQWNFCSSYICKTPEAVSVVWICVLNTAPIRENMKYIQWWVLQLWHFERQNNVVLYINTFQGIYCLTYRHFKHAPIKTKFYVLLADGLPSELMNHDLSQG